MFFQTGVFSFLCLSNIHAAGFVGGFGFAQNRYLLIFLERSQAGTALPYIALVEMLNF